MKKGICTGDRNLQINQVFPEEAFYHHGKGGCILDVTKPPFNAKGDGSTNDTQALCAAMRFVRDNYEIFREGEFSSCSQRMNRNWVIYLPDGKYLVDDTISQGWPALGMNIRNGWDHVEYLTVDSLEHEKEIYLRGGTEKPVLHGHPQLSAYDDNSGSYMLGQYGSALLYNEVNWAIKIIGQSRKNTIIRLKDSCDGFGLGTAKAVLSFYLLQRGSNINLGNFLENVTIDTGKNNPGATGLRWNSSNWGGVRNVAIRSFKGAGKTGILMECNNATGYLHDLLIEGFETGIKLAAGRETTITMEYVTLIGQRNVAIRVGNAGSGGGGDSLSARCLKISDVPRVFEIGRAGQVILLESEFTANSHDSAALNVEKDGFLLARDIRLSGFDAAVVQTGNIVLQGDEIDEFYSMPPVSIPERKNVHTMRLPVEDSPLILPEPDISLWACVEEFGAVGDGRTDDTSAIQCAMDSGKPVICFRKPNYVINGTVDIPASVREITFLFGAVQRTHASSFDASGFFRIAEASEEPLLIHRGVNAGAVFVEHSADRVIVMEDIFVIFNHVRTYLSEDKMIFPAAVDQNTEIWRLYRNQQLQGSPKTIFVNNCIGFAGDKPDGSLAVENVRVWGRMINTEHVPGALYSFRNSQAWIFGFKSENCDTIFAAKDHSRLEVLGGSFLNFTEKNGPSVISNDSELTTLFYMWHWSIAPELIWLDESSDTVTNFSAREFQPLKGEDSAVVFLNRNIN